MPYELEPRYPIVDGKLEIGYGALAADAASVVPGVLAVDGPAALDWTTFIRSLVAAIGHHNIRVQQTDVRTRLREWSDIQERTETPRLRDDPVFAKAPPGTLLDLFAALPAAGPHDAVTDPRAMEPLRIVFGPGAALAAHDALWYVDLPKRDALRAVEDGRAANLGQPTGESGTARRLMFVDWPLEDRHRRTLVSRIRRYVDLRDAQQPRSLTGETLRRSLAALVGGPFRTRPAFLAQPWGGKWAREVLGARESEPNAGLGYELIAPESGVLFGGTDHIEVALDLVLAIHAEDVLGAAVAQRFGNSFPIRFDYLDTAGGGDLSVHCSSPGRVHARDLRSPLRAGRELLRDGDETERAHPPRTAG